MAGFTPVAHLPYLCPLFFKIKLFSEDQNGSPFYPVDFNNRPGPEDLGENEYVLPRANSSVRELVPVVFH